MSDVIEKTPRNKLSVKKQTYHTCGLIEFVSPNVDIRECVVCVHRLCKGNKSFPLYAVADYREPMGKQKPITLETSISMKRECIS